MPIVFWNILASKILSNCLKPKRFLIFGKTKDHVQVQEVMNCNFLAFKSIYEQKIS